MKKILLILIAALLTGSAKAQSVCDSIATTVRYDAFSDTLIEVVAYNNSHTFFSYPGFILYNNAGDTVAKEIVNLFGLSYPSSHQLRIYPGVITNNTFNGSLQLWTNFYDSLNCTYQKSIKLCPDSCAMVYATLGNFGGASLSGNVNWSLKNSAQQTLASGILTLDSAHQFAIDSACLMPGNYTLSITPGTLGSGGQPIIGINTSPQSFALHLFEPFIGSPLQISFPFYATCMNQASITEASINTDLRISTNAGRVKVSSLGSEVGAVWIYNMEGRLIYNRNMKEPTLEADLSYLPAGMYIVKAVNRKDQVYQKIFLGGRLN